EEYFAAARLLGELGPEAASAVDALRGELPGSDTLYTIRLAESLGRIGPDARESVAQLKAKITDDLSAPTFRTAAAIAIWRISRDEDVAELLRKSLTGPKQARPQPHVALWRIDPSDATITELAKKLTSEDLNEVFLAADVLGPKAKGAVPSLLKILKEPRDVAQVEQAIAILRRIGPDAKDALEPLRVSAKAEVKTEVVIAARIAIYQIEPKAENALAIAELLEDKDMRVAAAQALKELRPTGQATVVELIFALENADEEVRLAAAGALWRIEKHNTALPAVIKLLKSSNAKVRKGAATDLGLEFGPAAKRAVAELTKRLFDRNSSVRAAAAEALGRIGPDAKSAAPALLTLLDGEEPASVQSAACEALGVIAPTDKDAVVAALRKKLDHPSALVRAHAALALYLVSAEKVGVEEEAIRGMGNRSYQVRITAAEAAWRMNKNGRAIPLLVRALEDSNLTGLESDNERYMAIRALGRIGNDGKPAVAELVRLVNHRDFTLSTAARVALKAIDPDAAKAAGVK
ncbi:MAG: HEAT repeat domain-containing protein, partial [Planctomycetia bacterium]|nr:HEAT repeat domain-containing protein [Planctomycetia bacterium]